MNSSSKNRIEDLKKKLYDKDDKVMNHQNHGVLHRVNYEVKADWDKTGDSLEDKIINMKNKPKGSIFKKFFIISIIFFLGALGFSFYKLYYNDLVVSSDKISIEVIGNSFTKGGEDLSLQIEIDNNNSANLEFANLIIEYPKGAGDGATDMMRIPRDSIGTIKPGEKVIRNIKVKLFGAEKSIRNIKVSLEYHPEGSNAIFTKEKYYPVTISVAPMNIDIEAPDQTISNQLISLKIKASLNTSLPQEENPVLRVTYPNNFVFESASPVPVVGNSVWDLSSLSLTNPIDIEIKGRLLGQEGDEQVFHAYVGSASETDPSNINITYSSLIQKVSITKPFLDAKILVNNKDEIEYSVSGGEDVDVSINWSNNLSTLITDGQIVATLSGNVLDKSKIKSSNGFYDSSNNQIIWDRNYIPDLAEINPGESGSVSFSFTPISLIGASNYVSDPQVSIKVSIRGKQTQLGSTYNEINNFTEKIVKLSSDFQIATSASYYEGYNPPKAENETKYKVTWTLSNSSNKVNDAVAKSSLPLYVNYVGLTSGEKENIKYNEVTREITWNIGTVFPGTGIGSNREASFILSIKPSMSQIGSIPQLMKELNLKGKDSFTGKDISSNRNSINISLAGGLRVVQ